VIRGPEAAGSAEAAFGAGVGAGAPPPGAAPQDAAAAAVSRRAMNRFALFTPRF
jgi:hypothetical protein